MTVHQLKKKLTSLLGQDNVLASREDLLCYAYDATKRVHVPEIVVFPGSVQEVSGIFRIASQARTPVVPRGAGSGMTGGALALQGGIVLAMNRFDQILEIDEDNLVAVVQPAVITGRLQRVVQEKGLFYPPDPASLDFSTLGGNIAENSGGLRAVKYGVTKDYVLGLEVVLPSGEVIQTGSKCVKDVVGYNLTQLLVGSEGTLGVVTRAILKLLPLPEAKQTLSAVFPDIHGAGRTVSEIIRRKVIPATIEFLDKNALWCVEHYLQLGLPESAGAFLLIEVDGDPAILEKEIRQVQSICEANQALKIEVAQDEKDQERLWKARRSVSASMAHYGAFKKINEDVVVPRASIPEFIKNVQEISRRFDVPVINFGHAGDGNIHVNVLVMKPEDEPRCHEAVEEIFARTVELGGRISGEHGIGVSKRDYIAKNLEPGVLELMKAIKKSFDPHNILNPNKMFP
ncbi:MAG: FAD-binding protein [Desulfohalobiaceae bacterium]|nr:FAD-binding protein [Desulfohalobiaceae bacterium]